MASRRTSTPRLRPSMPRGTSVASTNSRIASTTSTPRSMIFVSRLMRIGGCEPAVSTIPMITTAIAVVMLNLASRRATSAQISTISTSVTTPNTCGS